MNIFSENIVTDCLILAFVVFGTIYVLVDVAIDRRRGNGSDERS